MFDFKYVSGIRFFFAQNDGLSSESLYRNKKRMKGSNVNRTWAEKAEGLLRKMKHSIKPGTLLNYI